MEACRRKKRGVTMMELLLVMAIIALLMGILLPALAPAQGAGTKAQCLNNLRQIIATATLYALNDPKTILGPVHPQAYLFTGEGYAEYGGGPGTMNYMGWKEQSANNYFDPRTRPFNHMFFGKDGIAATCAPGACTQFEVFHCPGRELGWQQWPGFGTDPRETESPYFTANGTSYRMNNLAYSDGWTLGIYGRSITRIPVPGITLAFMEARTYQTMFTNDAWGYLTQGELTSYHDLLGYFNVAYADGHAAFVDFGNGTYYPKDPTIPPPGTGRDARGTWGRMDCLPELLFDPGHGGKAGGGREPAVTMTRVP